MLEKIHISVHVSLYIVPGDITMQSALIKTFHRLTLNKFLHVVAEFETTVTQSTM